jgi:two-component sensor histidine kinase
LALNELATNAAKYGALAANGTVQIICKENGATVSIEWRESCETVQRIEPSREGFGLKLLTKVLAPEFEKIEYDLQPEGARCHIVARL